MTPAPRTINATWTLATPPAPGAVAIIQLHGDIDAALAACAIPPTATGPVRLRDLLGIDRGIVARFAPEMCQLMPHGGVAIVRAILAELTRRGIAEADPANPTLSMYPEARSEVEAKALATLARAASPLAIDLLLAQHALWSQPGAASDPERDQVLRRLIDPPLVVAVGASNIGKSTLVNALAGRSVSIVADEPGTTRDHVGVMLDLAGLVVRYVDTPGLRAGASDLEQAAVTNAMDLAAAADLLLLCGDATSPPPTLPGALMAKPRRTVHLRADRGGPDFEADAAVSVPCNQGLTDLVAIIREALVPTPHLRAHKPWRFW